MDDIKLSDKGLASFEKTTVDPKEVLQERIDNQLLFNGKASIERADVRIGDVERWRVVNVANARTMKIFVEGASVRVIGTDGGFARESLRHASDIGDCRRSALRSRSQI